MRRRARDAGRGTRGLVRVSATGVILAAAALTAGAGPTAAQQVVTPRLAYTCAFPSGAQQVEVLVGAVFPDSASAGQPIQPTGTTITMRIPHSAVAGLIKLHAATVTAVASLTTTVTQGGASSDATWTNLKSAATPLPATGPVTLAAKGLAPSVTVNAPGNVMFTAADLSIVLIPATSNGGAAGSTAMPSECALNSGQNAVLATVPVTGSAVAPAHGPPGPIAVSQPAGVSRSGKHAAPQASGVCPPLPPGGLKLNPRFPPPKPPPGSKVVTATPITGCAYVIGFSDVRKLNGAALVGPGLTNLELYLKVIENQKVNYLQIDNAGELEYHGLHQFPPATSTLLSFGFMPVTATLQLAEIGTLNAYAVGPVSPIGCGKCITTTTIYSLLTLRIYNVKVNGVPLNVGNNCRTVTPFVAAVVGKSPQYNIATGGPLSGMITVPDFTGCGVGENLAPIFDATISGPGNFVKLTQGSLCTPNSGSGCPPTVPTPIR